MCYKLFVTRQICTTILAPVLLVEKLREMHDPYAYTKYLCFSMEMAQERRFELLRALRLTD